jgi:hypothetical protein
MQNKALDASEDLTSRCYDDAEHPRIAANELSKISTSP